MIKNNKMQYNVKYMYKKKNYFLGRNSIFSHYCTLSHTHTGPKYRHAHTGPIDMQLWGGMLE